MGEHVAPAAPVSPRLAGGIAPVDQAVAGNGTKAQLAARTAVGLSLKRNERRAGRAAPQTGFRHEETGEQRTCREVPRGNAAGRDGFLALSLQSSGGQRR